MCNSADLLWTVAHGLCLACSIADVVQLELEGAVTQYSAPEDSRRTVETLMDGNAWMIIGNTITGVLHWDLVSVNSTLHQAANMKISLS